MRVLGIDLAAAPEGTCACVLDEAVGGLRATIRARCDDATLLELADGCDKVAIDAPFGWPSDFVRAIAAHAAGQPWPATPDTDQKAFRRSLSFRTTDLIVAQTRRPLSVSTDRIGVTTMRCAYLLSQWSQDEPVDRTGWGRFVEVYPAAALCRWGLDASGYKGKANQQALVELVAQLSAAVPELELDPDVRQTCSSSDHAFDALVAALVGRAALLGLTDAPPRELRELAAQEGWIHLPLRSSLPFLARSRHALAVDPYSGLARRLRDGGAEVDEKGYVGRVEDVLLPAFGPGLRRTIATDLEDKGGSELRVRDKAPPKFFAAYSSAALAANTFGPFLGETTELPLGGRVFRGKVSLEVECPSGLPGTPPTLDCLVEGPEILAVESKCTETFSSHEARFRGSYTAAMAGAATTWREEFEHLVENPIRYRYLDAAQLVKHCLGLKTSYPDRRVMLLYLYWEPSNASELAPCAIHRAEIGDFCKSLRDPKLHFVAMSHRELWNEWLAVDHPAWLREHVEALRERYDVEV